LPLPPAQNLAPNESRQDIIRVARVTRKARQESSAALDGASQLRHHHLDGKTLRTVRRRNDLQSGSRLLVLGITARPDARRRRRVPLPELPARQNRSPEGIRQSQASL